MCVIEVIMPPKEDYGDSEYVKVEILKGCDWWNLPEDLKVQILCRLPAKDLVRYKSVSKYWYGLISSVCAPLISSPSPRASLIGFIHIGRRRHDPWGFVDMFPYVPGFINNLPFQPEPHNLEDCCNGLILLSQHSYVAPAEYYVCNLTTREYVRILDVRRRSGSYFCSLAFDPLVSPTSFKIIMRPVTEYHPSTAMLDVFSSETGNWTSHILSLEHELTRATFVWVSRSIYLNGILYLMSKSQCLVCIIGGDEWRSVMATRFVPLPGRDKYKHCGSFGAVKGQLVYSNSDARELLVWKLSSCGSSSDNCWILKYRISIDQLYAHPDSCWNQKKDQPIKAYAFFPDSEKIVIGTPSWVHSYDPATKSMEVIYRSGGRNYIAYGQHSVFPYLTCAVSLRER